MMEGFYCCGARMATTAEQLYEERLNRYVTAMRNEKPDMVPIRPFVAEFTGKYAGYTCQEVAHDYQKAFAAARKCAADFDWDAVVANMVYVWTGLTQAIGLKYYGIPGIDVPADMGFQYRRAAEDRRLHAGRRVRPADRGPDRLPVQRLAAARLVGHIVRRASRDVPRHNLSFLKGGMAMMKYFSAFGAQIARLREESGTVSAIAGIFKAPMDIIADKLRGYLGLAMDMFDAARQGAGRLRGADAAPAARGPDDGRSRAERADRLLDAPRLRAVRLARAVREHLLADASSRSSRSCGPTATRRSSTPKASGTHTSSRSPSCPTGASSITSTRATSSKAHRVLGDKFCLSGGMPNVLLAFGTPDDVRGLLQEESSTAWPATAATSWTPARSCRTTPGSRTSGR